MNRRNFLGAAIGMVASLFGLPEKLPGKKISSVKKPAAGKRMAILTYNSLKFDRWLTTNYSQEMVYDQSDTDLMYIKTTIRGQAIVDGTEFLDINPTDATPVGSFTALRWQFMQPRQKLSFTVKGEELIPDALRLTGSAVVDDRNGPKPRAFSIIGSLPQGSFVVYIEIETCFAETEALKDRSQIISHRWTEDVTIDENFYSTLTRNGRLRVSSASGLRTEQQRESCIVYGIPKGFIRKSMRYQRSEDGLELSYSIVDQEKYRMPPPPATWADGTYAETCENGAIRFALMTISLKGPKKDTCDQGTLMKIALEIILQRARTTGLVEAGKQLPFIRFSSFSEKLYDNEVTATARWICKPRKGLVKGNMAPISVFGKAPTYSAAGTASPDPGSRGTAGLYLQGAPYQSPTGDQSIDVATGNLTAKGTDPAGKIPGG